MAQFNFPSSPNNGDSFTQNGVTFQWDGEAWRRQGVAGAQGSTGSAGAQGATGSTGSTGAQGATGNTGAQGAQGHQGNTGDAGSTGAQGAQGIAGTAASQGAQGAQGAQGDDGDDASLVSGTNPPGSPSAGDMWWDSDEGDLLVYFNDGNSSQWVSTGSGPTGATGAQGHQGATGSTGAQGAQGSSVSNKPAFRATITGSNVALTNNSHEVIPYNNEEFDSDNCFDTSTHRFTPNVAGYYYVYASVTPEHQNADSLVKAILTMYKNSTEIASCDDDPGDSNNGDRMLTQTASAIVQMNGSSDYLECKVFSSKTGGSVLLYTSETSHYFQAFKLII